jgi:hypothetical protein
MGSGRRDSAQVRDLHWAQRAQRGQKDKGEGTGGGERYKMEGPHMQRPEEKLLWGALELGLPTHPQA